MKPKVADEIPPEIWHLFSEICLVVNDLPPLLHPPAFIGPLKISADFAKVDYIPCCHVVVDALAQFFPVEAHHGSVSSRYAKRNERRLDHAWLTIKGLDGRIIIDPWPLGAVSGPALFLQGYVFHFGNEFSPLRLEERDQAYLACVLEAVQIVIRGHSLKFARIT